MSVGVSFDFALNFTMVMGSFVQKPVLILTDQSEGRDGVCGHRLTNQRVGRVSVGIDWSIKE